MIYSTITTVKKTINVLPHKVPAIKDAAARGEQVFFTNSGYNANKGTVLFDGGLNYHVYGGKLGLSQETIEQLQAKGLGILDTTKGFFQFAYYENK
jgi:hypothetical protein